MSTHNTPDTFRYTTNMHTHISRHTYMQQYHNYIQHTRLYTDVHHSLMSTYNTQYILIHTTHTAVPHLHTTHLCMHSNTHTLQTHNSPMTTSHLLITHNIDRQCAYITPSTQLPSRALGSRAPAVTPWAGKESAFVCWAEQKQLQLPSGSAPGGSLPQGMKVRQSQGWRARELDANSHCHPPRAQAS